MDSSEDPAALLSTMLTSLLAGRGDRRALARLLTLAESEPERFATIADDVGTALSRRDPRALRVGVTGPSGAGKSTLIDALVRALRVQGLRVAVLATDPTSERSGGALLGDRIRFAQEKQDDGVFFRSVATRGAAGGLSHAGFDQLDLLELFGFDWILVEAVGAGQSEIEIAFAVDVTLVVFAPEGGDAVQALKAGLMEAGDAFCVSKADLPGAGRAAATLRSAVELESKKDPRAVPPVVEVAALQGGHGGQGVGSGIDELLRILPERADWLRSTGEAARRERARLARRVRHLALREFEKKLEELETDRTVGAGHTAAASPHRIAREYLDRLLRQPVR